MLFDTQGYWRFGKSMIYSTVSYLSNPKNTNGTPSILVGLLGPAANTPANANKLVNSVADQYLFRLGVATQHSRRRVISRVRWRSARKASDGTTCSGGPMASGVLATSCTSSRACRTAYKGQSFSFNVPVGLYRNRMPDPYTARKATRRSPTTCSSAATRSGSARARASSRGRSRSRLSHRPRSRTTTSDWLGPGGAPTRRRDLFHS